MDLSIKTSLRLSSWILSLTLATEAWASDVVYVPGMCDPSELTLEVSNKSSEAQRFWTQVRFDDEIKEDPYDLAPKTTLKISAETFLLEKSGFSVKAWDKNTLSISATCKGSAKVPLNDVTSPEVTHWLPSGTTTIKMHILNLFLAKNKVTVTAFDSSRNFLGQREVVLTKNYVTESFKWTLTKEVAFVEVSGDQRLHSWLFFESNSEEKFSPAWVAKPKMLAASPELTYFLVSTKENRPSESFVIALSDAQKIATAREQIHNKSLEKIIVAGIELGHGNFNRSFSSKDKSPYSWSVHRVDAFADFAHIDCDGSPDLTEERLMQKLNEGGRICFWRYRVVRELTLQEVTQGRLHP